MSRLTLPLELQRMILDKLYGEWHLGACESESPDGVRLIKPRPSPPYPASPLLVNHEWHRYATDLLSRNFSGVLDVTATSIRSRTGDIGRRLIIKETSRLYRLTDDFRHFSRQITTLRVDSCSMIIGALACIQKDLPSLESIEVVPTLGFRIHEEQLPHPKAENHPQDALWSQGWDSWFKTWITFTWFCSHRNLRTLRPHQFNVFYKQIFIFEDFDVARLVSIADCLYHKRSNVFQLVVFDVTRSPFTILSKQWL